jgi:hypothetical protein
MLDIQTAYNNPALDLPAVGVRDEGVDGVAEVLFPLPEGPATRIFSPF